MRRKWLAGFRTTAHSTIGDSQKDQAPGSRFACDIGHFPRVLPPDVPNLDSHYHNGRAYSHSPIDSVATEIQMNFRHLSARGLAGVLTAGLLVACSPDAGPDPSTTPVGSPSASASSSSTETAEEKKQREAFEAAEKAYRAAFAEVGRLSTNGGATKPSDILLDNAGGEYLSAQLDQLKWLADQDSRTTDPGSLGWVRRETYSPAAVTIEACEDFRDVLIVDSTNRTTAPEDVGTRVYVQRLTVKPVETRWKVVDLDTQQQAESCGT